VFSVGITYGAQYGAQYEAQQTGPYVHTAEETPYVFPAPRVRNQVQATLWFGTCVRLACANARLHWLLVTCLSPTFALDCPLHESVPQRISNFLHISLFRPFLIPLIPYPLFSCEQFS
jgi:hypothetical protein